MSTHLLGLYGLLPQLPRSYEEFSALGITASSKRRPSNREPLALSPIGIVHERLKQIQKPMGAEKIAHPLIFMNLGNLPLLNLRSPLPSTVPFNDNWKHTPNFTFHLFFPFPFSSSRKESTSY